MRLKFPRLLALARDQQGLVCQAWQEAWAPALPVALSDQRADDLIRMQMLLGDCQPSEGPDAWVWQEPRFSARAVYQWQDQRAGVYGGSYFLTTMARGMEESAAAQDSHIRLAPSPETPKDEGISAPCDIGRPGRLRIMCRCRGDLRAPFHYLSRFLVGMATGQCGPTRDLILGGLLEILRGGNTVIFGGVAAALLHTLVHMGPSKRSHI